jgi:hypothetical protein
MFHYDSSSDSFTFSGASFDFGMCTLEDIQKCIDGDKVYDDYYKTESIANQHNFFYNDGVEKTALKLKI